MRRTRLATLGLAATLTGVLTAPTLLASAQPADRGQLQRPPADAEPLNILLTNDDGWDAPGINAVYGALVAEGHHVTIVAPSSNQSGVSARVDFSGTLTAVQPVADDPNIWSVSTSPAGSVLFAMGTVLEEKPDLVISGTNVGANTGFDTNFSGTIGAATVATGMFDVPAIAVSTATTGWGHDATGPFEETADFVVDLIDRGLPTLDRGEFLNVNYPLLTEEEPEPLGVRYTPTSMASAAAFRYSQDPADPTRYRILGGRGTEQPAAGTDAAVLAEGYVTIGVLDADRSVSRREVPAVARLARRLD